MIYVCYTKLSEEMHARIIKDYLDIFSKEFQDRMKKYVRWQDAQASILGRLLLQDMLKSGGIESCDINQICYSRHGKPFFKHNNIHFSISHSGSIVVCAISHAYDIGVDIELISSVNLKDFHGVFTLNELEIIENAEDSQKAFFEYWTQKEASLKANGCGLLLPLNSFEIKDHKTLLLNRHVYLKQLIISEQYVCYLAAFKHFAKQDVEITFKIF